MKYIKLFEQYTDDDILNFLILLDAISTQLNRKSDESWSMDLNYKHEPNLDYIEVDYGAAGYSEGFSELMHIYYKETPIRVEKQNHGNSCEGGDFDNKSTDTYNSFAELIAEIKDEFGIE